MNVEPWCSQPAYYMIRGLSWRNSSANISLFVLCDTVANNQVNENLWFLQLVYHIFWLKPWFFTQHLILYLQIAMKTKLVFLCESLWLIKTKFIDLFVPWIPVTYVIIINIGICIWKPSVFSWLGEKRCV